MAREGRARVGREEGGGHARGRNAPRLRQRGVGGTTHRGVPQREQLRPPGLKHASSPSRPAALIAKAPKLPGASMSGT
jgi:hypothetical protein